MNIDLETSVDDFATRCFRDNADQDYIVARICYRSRLFSQFKWSAHQAIEKYYKAMFLYNRIKAPDIFHSLEKAQIKAKDLPFNIEFSKSSIELIDYLNKYGDDRYLVGSYEVHGPKLRDLDQAVWEIRKYCSKKSVSKKAYPLIGGRLESIMADVDHPAKPHLTWNNANYGVGTYWDIAHIYVEKTPLSLSPELPELINYLKEYVKLPEKVIEEYRPYLKLQCNQEE